MPGTNSATTPTTHRISDATMIMIRTSMMSARPAPAMPTRKITSRMTNSAENTRPRSSRGVLRWRSVCRATAEGELKKPDSMTQTIAIPIVGDSP